MKTSASNLEIAQEIGDRMGEGNALGNLGSAFSDLGDHGIGIGYYEQQLGITHDIGDRQGEGNAMWNMAQVFHDLGDLPQAIARAEAALPIYEQIGHPSATTGREALEEWRREAGEK